MKNPRKLNLLIIFSAFSAGFLLLSNIAATKLWNFFGIAVDGGLLCFPLTYILGDLIVEFFGKKTSKTVIYTSLALNIISVIIIWSVISLPSHPDWNMQEAFSSVLGFTPRIIFGSLIAFLFSNLINNSVFTKMKDYANKNVSTKNNFKKFFTKSFIMRALSSSFIAHFIDALIFETVAFLGVLPFQEFIEQALFAYAAGLLIEIILSPIENLIEKSLKKYISAGEN